MNGGCCNPAAVCGSDNTCRLPCVPESRITVVPTTMPTPSVSPCMCLYSTSGCETNSDCCPGLQCNVYSGWSQCLGELPSSLLACRRNFPYSAWICTYPNDYHMIIILIIIIITSIIRTPHLLDWKRVHYHEQLGLSLEWRLLQPLCSVW